MDPHDWRGHSPPGHTLGQAKWQPPPKAYTREQGKQALETYEMVPGSDSRSIHLLQYLGHLSLHSPPLFQGSPCNWLTEGQRTQAWLAGSA